MTRGAAQRRSWAFYEAVIFKNMIADLIRKNRSCRRFYQDHAIEPETLTALIELARMSASASNMQPLKYIISADPQTNSSIFPCLAWAGYLEDWHGPEQGERPAAYVVVLGDTEITGNFLCDHGIASQSILLGAREKGLGGCIIAAIKKTKLRKVLHIPEKFKILLVLAIGKPKEKIIIETVEGNNIRYWRDTDGVHHVPKRKLKDIIIASY